jgi:hypothetical protein
MLLKRQRPPLSPIISLCRAGEKPACRREHRMIGNFEPPEGLGRNGVTWRPPGTGKFLCPECSSTRKKKREKCLKVWEDQDGELFWKCYNPGCGSEAQRPLHQKHATGSKPAGFPSIWPRSSGWKRCTATARRGCRFPTSSAANGEPQVSADLRKAPRDGHRRPADPVEPRLPARRRRSRS